VAWHAATTKQTDLVMIPLRMALWQRHREGHPTIAGELIHHSDAGSIPVPEVRQRPEERQPARLHGQSRSVR
jgi:hypothetical protein